MKNTTLYLLLAAAAILLQSPLSNAQTLKADYQFQGNLSSSIAGAPDLTNLIGAGNGPNTFITNSVDGFDRTVLNFPLNNGVAINSLTGVVSESSFTVVILCRMGPVSNRRRIYDVSGGTQAEEGGFLLNGRLEGEDTSIPSLNAGTFFQLVITRGGGFIKSYRDGVLRLSDVDEGSPLPDGIRLFQDYVHNPVQAAGGAIARMRFYDAPLTIEQIHQLDRAPEAPTGAMPLLFFSSRNGTTETFRMNADGTSQRRLTNTPVSAFRAKFSPNGQKIVYQRRETTSGFQNVWVSNADGSDPQRLTNSSTNDISPSWRPDGQKILFSRCDANLICDIFTMDPDGSNQTAFPGAVNTADDEDNARFTSDGTKIAFVCGPAISNLNICTANANGTNRTQITNTPNGTPNHQIDISPDGSKIIFIRGGDPSLYRTWVTNFDGSGAVPLPPTQAPFTPLWSPDGTRIAYSTNFSNSNEIFIANADGSSPVQITFNSVDDRLSDWYRPSTRRSPFDFDGDGKADLSIFRPSAGEWYYQRSSNGVTIGFGFGTSTDKPMPADYTGDGKADIAFFRPSTSEWYVLRSEDSTFYAFPFGAAGDIPAPADYDGDAKADATVYRPSAQTWFILKSTGGVLSVPFGLPSDIPVPADYDGDGKADVGIYRPSLGQWWNLRSSNGNVFAATFGASTDKPVVGDYTGDGKADVAFYRPAEGGWYVLRSEDFTYYAFPFGNSTDKPAPADFDGDGKFDAAVFRPSDTNWYILKSTGGIQIQQFGAANDIPLPGAFVP